VLHHAIEDVGAKYQTKVLPRLMHLTEHYQMLFVTRGVDDVSLVPAVVAETNGIWFAAPTMTWDTAKINVPIDDNDVEGRGRCDGGEYSSEEVGCVVACDRNRLRRGLECPQRLVP